MSTIPTAAREFRRRIRVGFALCAAALITVLAYAVVSITAMLAAPASLANLESRNESAWKLSGVAIEGLTTSLLVAGLVLLYRVPYGPRWRWASLLLLAMCGVDVAFLSFRAAGGDPKLVAVTAILGMAIGWVELWILAVLGAEAAEAAERPDVTYQTEVVGKLVIWASFTWLLAIIWSFDAEQLGRESSATPPPQDVFMVIVSNASLVLHIMVLARTIQYCLGLVYAYAPDRASEAPT